MAYTSLTDGQRILSEHSTDLPTGEKIVTEIIQTGERQFVTASILIGTDGATLASTYCGTCDGVSVGCVNCANNDPVLDCVNRRIYCAS